MVTIAMRSHRILHGDVWACLLTLENASIDCIITSPPYWQQRNYGFREQLGHEEKLEDYLAKLVTIFDLLREKLVPQGVFYLNLGDKYLSKYGNSSLALIPFRLVYHLKKSGWRLEDILIWYKPNHMPSSVKNRLTNTYEPIFVLTKEPTNYYQKFKENNELSTILSIPLQPLPYKHMATFPEKLVETLLLMGLPPTARILDPFAGSGTTCVGAQTISSGYFSNIKMTSIMIEANPEFVKIIQERCKISRSRIIQVPFEEYSTRPLTKDRFFPDKTNGKRFDSNITPLNAGYVFIKMFQSSSEFNSFLPSLSEEGLNSELPNDGICFIGLSDPIIEDIMVFSSLKRWIVRNIIVVPQNGGWKPIVFLVKDIKSVRYRFNLDSIRVSPQTPQGGWKSKNFLGLRVERTQALFKTPLSGKIAKILKKYSNGLPQWVVVHWNSGKTSIEEVMDEDLSFREIQLNCPSCLSPLATYHDGQKNVKCPNCQITLWESWEWIPILKTPPRKEPDLDSDLIKPPKVIQTKRKYEGKFRDTEKMNRGQSPGARSSLEEPFFSVKRFFSVNQPLVCDYLNLHRKKTSLTKIGLTKLFPPDYKHTVGHWLRKDMGGSLPKLNDLQKLKEILNLDDSYVDYVGRTGIKLQTVQHTRRGKNPGDFLNLPLNTVISLLQKLGT
jgi:site-specific DNA-methyltransferase (adenine-specific)